MTIYRRTPEPPTDPPESKIVGWCAGCLGEIYEGGRRYGIDGKLYCKACVDASEVIL